MIRQPCLSKLPIPRTWQSSSVPDINEGQRDNEKERRDSKQKHSLHNPAFVFQMHEIDQYKSGLDCGNEKTPKHTVVCQQREPGNRYGHDKERYESRPYQGIVDVSCCRLTRCVSVHSLNPSLRYQIEKRKQVYPNDIYKVPIEAGIFELYEIVPVDDTASCINEHDGYSYHSDQHMNAVNSGHYII